MIISFAFVVLNKQPYHLHMEEDKQDIIILYNKEIETLLRASPIFAL